ncbi:EAL domain-containing protein [Noviherbaspirillum sp. 1P10PC]|uniref:sensor domain-containing protein n=1 Tax=Noviherbaspirillum sp. 1P10PC TaxID=3132292 RepID=UPI00399F50DC
MPKREDRVNRTAEDLLRIGQEQLSLIYDNVSDVLFALDVTDEGRFKFSSINKKFTEATGLSKSDVVGKYIEEVIPPPAHALVLRKYREAISTRKAVSWEEISVYPTGEKVGQVTVAPVIDVDNECRQLIGTVHDVTEYRHMNDLLERTEERWRLALEGSGAGVWDWKVGTSEATYSAHWKRLLGYRDEEISNDVAEWESRLHPEDKSTVMAVIQGALENHRPSVLTEHRLRHKNGNWLWCQSHGMISYDGAGKPERMIGTVVDITARIEAEATTQLAALVYKNTSEAIIVTDAAGVIVATNQAFAKHHELTEDQLLGMPLLSFFKNIEGSESYAKMQRHLLETGHWKGEVWRRKKDGTKVTEVCTVDTVYAADGSVSKHILLFLDISDQKLAEEVIWRQANFDSLTSLPNRFMFADRLRHALDLARRNKTSVALLFIDLDRFKEVNDGLGHSVGDDLLIQVAKRLEHAVGKADTIARLGGDEFAVVLIDLDDKEVERTAELVTTVLALPFDLDGHVAYVSASIGIAYYPRDATHIENLIKHADQAMYSVKREGGNRHGYFLASMQEKALARRRLVNNLHRAISEQQMEVHYQPIVNLKDGSVAKAEALLRWAHPDEGNIRPDIFIPLAEEIGIIDQIGEWVCSETLKAFANRCRGIKSSFQVSINFSPIQFRGGKDAFYALFELMDKIDVSSTCIVLELTEGTLLNLDERMVQKFAMLKHRGVQLALDDFGTGYSSLSYITKLKFDFLKIDQVFVRNLENSETSLALCETMIVMAHKLGMKVIAEGIETKEQQRMLTEAGCDYGQGYLFAKPMAFVEFEDFISGSLNFSH